MGEEGRPGFADAKAKRRVDSEITGVVSTLVARRDLVVPLADHLTQGVPGMDGDLRSSG